MVAAKWGRIINLSSLSAVGNRGQVNYSAAKAGLQGLTKTLALELGKFGITANAVAPGFVVTDMTAATAARLGISFEDFQAGAAKQIPVQRVGQVEDIAHAISFFASEGPASSAARSCTCPAARSRSGQRTRRAMTEQDKALSETASDAAADLRARSARSAPSMIPRPPRGPRSSAPGSTRAWPPCTTR